MSKKKKKAHHKILIGLNALLVLIGLACYIAHWVDEKSKTPIAAQTLENPGQIKMLFIGFRIKNSRWPANLVELENYLNEDKPKENIDLSAYQNLTFGETPGKKFKIHYDSYKKGNVTGGPYDAELALGS